MTLSDSGNLRETEYSEEAATVSRTDSGRTDAPRTSVSTDADGTSETVAVVGIVEAAGSAASADLGRIEGMLLIIAFLVAVLVGVLFSNIFFKRGGD